MKRFFVPVLLVAAGGLLLAIGGFLLFAPHSFFAENGVTLGTDPNLMSEIRAPAGVLLVSGCLIALAAIVRELRSHALGLAGLIYGAYGASRLVSIAFDGVPSEGIIAATAIELTVGCLALVAFYQSRRAADVGGGGWLPPARR